MTLSDFTSIANIVQGIVVIVSLFFIWYQLQENVLLTKAANVQHLTELSTSLNMQLIPDREVAMFWVQGAKEWDRLDEIHKFR